MNTKLLSGTGLILGLIAFVALNIWSNATLTSWRLDLTEHKLFTLSPGTKNILAKLDEPITLRFYFSQQLLSGVPELSSYGNRVRDMLEEYVAHSGGKLQLKIIDPEPFSEAEDLAVAYGLRQLPFSSSGEVAYFGLVGSNTTDDEIAIPFFQPRQQESLEYDLTKLIYDLANPKKRVIGVMTSLPMFGDPMANLNPLATGSRSTPPWAIIALLEEHFELREIPSIETNIPPDIDTLLVVHPKDLSMRAVYTLDQFILRGGKAMLFLDPYSESDVPMRDPGNPMAVPDTGSDLPDLLAAWGLKLEPGRIVGDFQAAIRVAYAGDRGRQEIEYLPWLALHAANLNQDDFVTNQLNVLNLGTSGALVPTEQQSDVNVIPLVTTSRESMLYEVDSVRFNRNPAMLLTQFRSEDKSYWLAVRVTGRPKTAFPEGRPEAETSEESTPDTASSSQEPAPEMQSKPQLSEAQENINVIIVADTDLLADQFWVQNQTFLGLSVPSAFADNGDFLVNAVDNLGGNSDLISLRSRGSYSRPFEKVDELRRLAEAQFRDKEQTLLSKLDETRAKIAELQSQRGDGSENLILTTEQREEIEQFQKEELKTRKELRAVQHDLRKNIESLGAALKFINIGLIPLLIGLFAVALSVYRASRAKTQ
jgi:ABC-type uncharacterized transport system involved in gliding motility auxiliary subunit